MKPLLPLLSVCVSLLLAAGCATTPPVVRVEPGGPASLTTTGIDIADFKNAAGKMVESMLAQEPSPFARVQGRTARLIVNHVKNDTSRYFDVSQITHKITTDLMKSGKAETVTAFGSQAPDRGATIQADEEDFKNDRKQTTSPDFSLSGKILQTVAREGKNKREFSYTLQLSLTDVTTRSAVWQDEQIVSKQISRPTIGF